MKYVWYAGLFGSWFYFRLQATGFHYIDSLWEGGGMLDPARHHRLPCNESTCTVQNVDT
jgi:hypothetical protein